MPKTEKELFNEMMEKELFDEMVEEVSYNPLWKLMIEWECEAKIK